MKKTAEEYDLWGEQKKAVQASERKNRVVRQGQIRRYYEGMNIGREQSKGAENNFVRACIVLSSGIWKQLVLIAPLTTSKRKGLHRTSIHIHNSESHGLKPSSVLLNHIRVIDEKRLVGQKASTIPFSSAFVGIIKERFGKLIK